MVQVTATIFAVITVTDSNPSKNYTVRLISKFGNLFEFGKPTACFILLQLIYNLM